MGGPAGEKASGADTVCSSFLCLPLVWMFYTLPAYALISLFWVGTLGFIAAIVVMNNSEL